LSRCDLESTTVTTLLFTTTAPTRLSDELMLAGFRVFEALAVSEVRYLIETQNAEAVTSAVMINFRKKGGLLNLFYLALHLSVLFAIKLVYDSRNLSGGRRSQLYVPISF
jgi:DMSO/TMAO reductase YedYZ heme-binding membrane subunit